MVLTGLSCSSSAGPTATGTASPTGTATPAATGTAPVTGATSPPWKEVWSDDFNGPAGSGVNTAYWKYDTGNGVFGTSEVETMTSSPSNVHLDGHGDLDIVMQDHGSPGSPGSGWTSGRLQTISSGFGAPAGGEMKVTASIKQPGPGGASGLGYWPGFWMLGPSAWPMGGEIDIMEDVNGLSAEAGTLHCGNLVQRNSDGTFGPCHEGTGLGSGLQPCPGCQQGFHTYTVIVDRRNEADQQIRWYLDGREFYSVSEGRMAPAVWAAAVDHGFSILLDVAMGGSYPDNQCRCTAPSGQTAPNGVMVVQYVTVYTN